MLDWLSVLCTIFSVRTAQNVVNQSKQTESRISQCCKKFVKLGHSSKETSISFSILVISPKRDIIHMLGEVVVSAFQCSRWKGKWHIKLVTCS